MWVCGNLLILGRKLVTQCSCCHLLCTCHTRVSGKPHGFSAQKTQSSRPSLLQPDISTSHINPFFILSKFAARFYAEWWSRRKELTGTCAVCNVQCAVCNVQSVATNWTNCVNAATRNMTLRIEVRSAVLLMWRRVFGWAVGDVATDNSAVTEDTVVLGNGLKHLPNDTASPEPPMVWLWHDIT